MPPPALLGLGDVILPALPKSSARSIIDGASKKPKLQYSRYLTQWPPTDDPESPKHYTTSIALFRHTAKGREKKESPGMPWLNRYLRARIEQHALESASQIAAGRDLAEPRPIEDKS